jgi:hypothetical protein
MTAMRPLLVLLALASIAAAAAGAASDPVRATMTTSSKMPLVDMPWRYTIVVKNPDGRPLPAKVRLQILLGNVVVGCWKGTAMVACSGANAGTWITFKGKRTGVLEWPAQSAGVKLTFQATVVSGTRSLRLRAPVTVRLP